MKIKRQINRLKSAVSSYISKKLEKFKSPKAKAVFKIIILGSYCTLICAAILFSFKSVFNTFSGTKNASAESLLTDRYISDILNNSGKSLEVLSKPGASGEEVSRVQSALKNMGYYLGGIDGTFGVKTQDAVMRFQKARGLEADGIVGPQTLKALGLQIDAISANYENEINLLARLISAEARGEPYAGQVAVGAVVLNRVSHTSFPDSISAVIYQPNAFAGVTNGEFSEPVAESAYRAARDALNNSDPTGGALYYYNPKTEKDKKLRSRKTAATIGSHVFCS